MTILEHYINDLIKLSQLLLSEEGRNDINGIANSMLDILQHIKENELNAHFENKNWNRI